VRYIGDNVAAVAATSAEIAEEALELIEVDYDPLPAWFDPLESMKAAADWIHESKPHNIEKEYHHEFGNLEQGFANAAFVARNITMPPRSPTPRWSRIRRWLFGSPTGG